ncbi:DUF4440 domain-containing protein [Paracoccus sp. MC1854]|uniref:DUF4440 domain-containing protein n=1 Tax=Paracoccus sp. MC1854 TaxID=2760306 RepID=UPI001600D5D0|nr:DUF4440 domain-containing protein [Paracoccus sp. MC1854]MBB1491675.1 DUF4440 domain-containing protein [Paracoccus sp. MC1854]
MDDKRVWEFEESLWRASEERYHERVDPDCVMALSRAPWLFTGDAAIEAVSHTPAWDEVAFSQQDVRRPQEGLIAIAYCVVASREGTRFAAACTSVYRRRGHDDWTVVQHTQIALDPQENA